MIRTFTASASASHLCQHCDRHYAFHVAGSAACVPAEPTPEATIITAVASGVAIALRTAAADRIHAAYDLANDARQIDEATRAALDRAIEVIGQLMAVVVSKTQHYYAPQQAAINEAAALLAEHGRGDPDRFEAVNAVWMQGRR
jgi:hypothetical protein